MNLVKKCNGTRRIKHQLIAGLLQLGNSRTTRAYIHPPANSTWIPTRFPDVRNI